MTMTMMMMIKRRKMVGILLLKTTGTGTTYQYLVCISDPVGRVESILDKVNLIYSVQIKRQSWLDT